MKKMINQNAKKALMDYKLEISKELGVDNSSKSNKAKKKNYSEKDFNNLGRS